MSCGQSFGCTGACRSPPYKCPHYAQQAQQLEQRERALDLLWLDARIREINAKRDAMYVDPYREAVGRYLEYECGIPNA